MHYVFLGMMFFFSCISEGFTFGLTVDQMYRNLLGSEDEIRHPAVNKPLLTFKKADTTPEKIWQEKRKKLEMESQKTATYETKREWKDIVLAVKKGNVSPFDLAEIRRLSERENPEAIELLAWMYATGTGLRQDLQKSYTYYLQAAHMGIASAYDNVRAVYLAMSPAQRASLPAF